MGKIKIHQKVTPAIFGIILVCGGFHVCKNHIHKQSINFIIHFNHFGFISLSKYVFADEKGLLGASQSDFPIIHQKVTFLSKCISNWLQDCRVTGDKKKGTSSQNCFNQIYCANRQGLGLQCHEVS